MEATEAMTLFLIEKLLAIALAYQAIEYIQINKKLRLLLAWPKWYSGLPYALLIVSIIQLFHSDVGLLLITAAIFIFLIFKFRGPFNGGSDYMTALVLFILILSHAFSENRNAIRGLIMYLGLQALLSYLVAGIVKVRNSEWRSGAVLSRLLNSDYYLVPQSIKSRLSNPKVCVMLSWIIISFEILFPLGVSSPFYCLTFLQLGILFHIGNAYALGLNRFFWSWITTYPAIFYLSLTLAGFTS